MSSHANVERPFKHRNCIIADHTRTNTTFMRYMMTGGPFETIEIRERALNPINRTTGVHISILLST